MELAYALVGMGCRLSAIWTAPSGMGDASLLNVQETFAEHALLELNLSVLPMTDLWSKRDRLPETKVVWGTRAVLPRDVCLFPWKVLLWQ